MTPETQAAGHYHYAEFVYILVLHAKVSSPLSGLQPVTVSTV